MADEEKSLARATRDFFGMLARIDEENPAPADLTAFRQALQENPGLWQAVGDMADQAVSLMLQSIGGNPVAKEFARGNYGGLKRDLGWESASPLEKILIGQVALTWLRLNLLEEAYTQNTMTSGETYTHESGSFWDRRLSAAQRRHLRACETLARVRKMGIAALQVNIAQQQVNVAGGS